GYFTMMAAACVGPRQGSRRRAQPLNARLIEASRRMNQFDNIEVAQVAAGRRTELLMLSAGQSNGTTAALSPEFDAMLNSVSVPAITLDGLLRDYQHVDFIKIDVE